MLWCFYAVTLGNAQAGGGGVNILCNMLIDSMAPFRWVIFFSFFLHYRLQKHTHTHTNLATKLREIRPKTSAAAARLLKYEWF